MASWPWSLFNTPCGLQHSLWPSALPVAFSTSCGLQHSLRPSALTPCGPEVFLGLQHSLRPSTLTEAFSAHSLWPGGNSEAFSTPWGLQHYLPVAWRHFWGLQHSLWPSALPVVFSTPWGLQHSLPVALRQFWGLRLSLWPSALPVAWRHSWGTNWQSGSSKAVWRFLFQEPLLQAIPEPTHHPVYCISEECSVKPRLRPFKYPILLNHAWVALTLVNDCMCIVLISCCDIVVSSKSGQKEVNLLWTLHIS